MDITAERMPTPSRAASQVGKISMKSAGSALLAPPEAWKSSSPRTTRAFMPPSVMAGSRNPDVNARVRKRVRDRSSRRACTPGPTSHKGDCVNLREEAVHGAYVPRVNVLVRGLRIN